MASFPSGSRERERVDSFHSHLPRLAPEFYRGYAYVHWTLNLRNRATGWLSAAFHAAFREALIHTCARHRLAVPTYVLMPDHLHVLSCGLHETSDQRLAIEFLRKHLASRLHPFEWQRQPYDNVLRESDCERDAFIKTALYILENPVRERLSASWQDYEFSGACVAKYPDLDPRQADYWERFWKIYYRELRIHSLTLAATNEGSRRA
jgi:putative transposase